MNDATPDLRRRSPGFVRQWTNKDLHAVAMRFSHDRQVQVLSDQQEWLWDMIVNELEYRRRAAIRKAPLSACSCWLCVPSQGQLDYFD